VDGSEPISNDEFLFRRIPVSKDWYLHGEVSPQAFDPRHDEDTGISIYRARYKTVDQAAQGLSKRGYFVAELRVGDLRKSGIEVVPSPEPDDPGHAEIPALNCNTRGQPAAEEIKLRLATQLCIKVHGPFIAPQ